MISIEDAVEETKKAIADRGVRSLVVDDLKTSDLEYLQWSGSTSHMISVAKALERAEEVDYLVVRSPSGYPISKGGVDYAVHMGAGTLWQLATHLQLQSMGIGTVLIDEAERRIKQRWLTEAIIGVEDDNPRARELYERLGYKVYGHQQESWMMEDENGEKSEYRTNVTLLKKEIG